MMQLSLIDEKFLNNCFAFPASTVHFSRARQDASSDNTDRLYNTEHDFNWDQFLSADKTHLSIDVIALL